MDISDEFDFGSLVDEKYRVPVQEAPDTTRKRKPYREASARPATKSQAHSDANRESNIFSSLLEDEVTPLNELYIDASELRQMAKNGTHTHVSLFSGCLGSTTGSILAGARPLLAVEFVKAARDTIAANYDVTLIEPLFVLELAQKWLQDNELGFEPVINKTRKNRGVQHSESFNWELTIKQAIMDAGGDSEKLDRNIERFNKLRYDVTLQALKTTLEDTFPVWGDDIRGLCGHAVLEFLEMEPGDLDEVEGSPPCKSFSMSGLRERGWGQVLHYSDERDQQTDDLFAEFIRIVSILKPKVFTAENVAGIGMGEAATTVLAPLMESIHELGYSGDWRLLNAMNYSVAQSRPRAIFQGVRHGLCDKETGKQLHPVWPKKHPYIYSCQDALDVSEPATEEELSIISLEGYETGKIWKILEWGQSPQEKAYQLVRSHPDSPVQTITATGAGNIAAAGITHPHEPRKFTIEEYRYLSGFPRGFEFVGTIEQQGERVGRAVPPYFMKAISEPIRDEILNRIA